MTTTNTDTTHNGWSNYATWRIDLELCSDILNSLDASDLRNICTDPETARIDLADYLQATCKEIISDEDSDAQTLATQYALAFLGQVNFWEIAESHLMDNPLDAEGEDAEEV